MCSNVLLNACIQLEMFAILFKCSAFLVLVHDAEKVMDEEVGHKAPQPEPSAAGTNSKGTGLNQMQHSVT